MPSLPSTTNHPGGSAPPLRDQGLRRSRRGDILETFTRMVAERGYDAVTLREIAAEVGISKATIIHHFGSKEQMLSEIHEVYIRERIAEAHVIVAGLPTPALQVVGLMYQNFLSLRNDYVSTVAFAREIVRFSRDGGLEPVRQLRREYSGIVQDAVQRGLDDGTFAGTDARLLTLQVFGTFNWVWTWLRPGGEWTLEHIAETFIATLLGGLLRDDGRPTLDEVAPVVLAAMGQAVAPTE